MASTKLDIYDQIKAKAAGGSAAAGDMFYVNDTAGTIAKIAAGAGVLINPSGSSPSFGAPWALALTEAPGGDGQATGVYTVMTAGENVVFGDVCYFKSDGKLWKADANAAGAYPCMAMATMTISANATGTFLLMGIARLDAWGWTVGGVIYLSTTAGSMAQTQPAATDDVIQVLGVATHADRMYFNPVLTWITHT